MTTEALLIIDLQRDYFHDGELERCRDDLVAVVNRLARAADVAGALVVEVRTVHDPDRSTWTLSMLEDDQGMVLAGTDGSRPVPGLDVAGAEPVEKTRDSAFFDTRLAALLDERHVSAVILVGISTESCIAATAADAFARNLRVTVVEDATASIEWSLHDQTLDRLRAQYRQEVVPSERLIERWTSAVAG